MALNIDSGVCDDPVRPTICMVPLGTSFTLSVDVLNAPEAGYILVQTFIDYGLDLTYNKAPTAAEEIVWPDLQSAVAIRSEFGPGLVNHGGLSGLFPPIPPSFFEGNVVELSMNCTSAQSSTFVELLPEGDSVAGTSGSAFKDPDDVLIVPNLHSLTINCTDVPADADSDGDGCSNLREYGSDETLGGMRDWQNANDFYDVIGGGGGEPDGVIDLPNDILGVIQHFSPTGAAPYDVQFDRGPSAGPDPWNMTAPDGVIDLPNDILGVILQFNHRCA